MRRLLAVGLLFSAILSAPLIAAEVAPAGDADKERIRGIVKEVLREYAASLGSKQADPAAKAFLKGAVQDNRKFMRSRDARYFKPLADGQKPRATVVSCADSRVHSHAFDATPDGDVFMVRNIGNQIATAQGSVEYGVRQLKTPVLLIVGHSGCGAVKAAAGDYSEAAGAIRSELDGLQVPKGEGGASGVRINVDNQVRHAMSLFEEEVISGRLTIVGAIYDLRNELKQGHGKLDIVNVNGETEPAKIAAMDVMQGINAPARPAARGY